MKQRPPHAQINYAPVRGIRPGAPVEFDIRADRLGNIRVDFGDGVVENQERRHTHTHAYARPGTYFVTVSGDDAGAGPGVFRVRVVVED